MALNFSSFKRTLEILNIQKKSLRYMVKGVLDRRELKLAESFTVENQLPRVPSLNTFPIGSSANYSEEFLGNSDNSWNSLQDSVKRSHHHINLH